MVSGPILSVDSGSSWLKMLADTGARLRQPAAVKILDAHAPPFPDEVRVDGRRYVVGHTALWSAGAQDAPLTERGYHGGPLQHAQICHGLEQMGLQGEGAFIMHSLPYEDHQAQDTRGRVKQNGRVFVWEVRDAAGQWQRRQMTFAEARTMPQGTGALRQWQADHPDQTPQQVLLADLGSCTADVVTVRRDPRTDDYAYCNARCRSLRAGLSSHPVLNGQRFWDVWAASIADLEGMQQVRLGFHELMLRAEQKRFVMQYGRHRVDLAPAFSATAARYTQDVLAALRQHADDSYWKAEVILLTGGGAALLMADAFDDPRFERLDIWANAAGQLHAARNMVRHAHPQEKSHAHAQP